jgi:phosphomannomutase
MTLPVDVLRAEATRWIEDDPDPADQAELRALLDSLPDVDSLPDGAGGSAGAELADRFGGTLTFGTAGLRGPLRAGPNGMNRAVVRGAAAGLVGWLGRQGVDGPVVIGYDARYRSREFAEETARVVTGAGREALLLPRPLPTPVLAYAVRLLGAVAGVMVTASHNPPQDNGYKVYLGAALGGPEGAGAQIVPPVDAEIEAAIRAVGPLSRVPLGRPGTVPEVDLVTSYVDSVASVVAPGGPRDLSVAYTPLHGVGGDVLRAAVTAAGFPTPSIVDSQAEPDPDFPTVSFPNPEEPGAMDRVIALAAASHADLAVANDPDADRCAVAVPHGDGWRMLRGDEVGVLLADHLMRRGVTGRYATTIVSSSLLGAMCHSRGLPYGETLTGFKWIVRAGDACGAGPSQRSTAGDQLAYGYEEALGYCVAPDLVRDKDGISAALLVCELAAALKAEGRGLSDRLDEIAAEYGVYATDQLSVRVDDLTEIDRMMTALRAQPPARLLGEELASVEDRLPDSDVLILRHNRARVVVRPSGTEPKLKAYLEVIEPIGGDGVPAARQRATTALAALRAETAAALGLV